MRIHLGIFYKGKNVISVAPKIRNETSRARKTIFLLADQTKFRGIVKKFHDLARGLSGFFSPDSASITFDVLKIA